MMVGSLACSQVDFIFWSVGWTSGVQPAGVVVSIGARYQKSLPQPTAEGTEHSRFLNEAIFGFIFFSGWYARLC
jgi:hypothetical protein